LQGGLGKLMTGKGEEARVDFWHEVDLIHGTRAGPVV
jgi:hypothetical protein